MGAPQLRHRPRRDSHVISGRLRNHGMEYLQCGQWEGGDTMLSPNGRRWMQTLRKLPTTEPNTKNTTDQKWKGTADQFSGVKMDLNMRIKTPNSKLQAPEKLQTPNPKSKHANLGARHRCLFRVRCA